ncbi:MAG: desulfoferrodoxin [Lachnospiraceae bacterium]|jgi:superoxide reductase|nr:desulfoferrodoxin [Lachnospiraceae bacterium]
MKNNKKFFKCAHCGNIAGLISDKGAPLMCCGEKMQELLANTVEASQEKHLPSVTLAGDKLTVAVGSVHHPMEAEHYITFVFVETTQGGQRKDLAAGTLPTATFAFADDKPLAVYAYCNLHGLWKTEI